MNGLKTNLNAGAIDPVAAGLASLEKGGEVDNLVAPAFGITVAGVELVSRETSSSPPGVAVEIRRIDHDAVAAGMKAASAGRDFGQALDDFIPKLYRIQSFMSQRGRNHDLAKILDLKSRGGWLQSVIVRSGLQQSRATIYRRLKAFGALQADSTPSEPSVQSAKPKKPQAAKVRVALNNLVSALTSGEDVSAALKEAEAIADPAKLVDQLPVAGPADPEGPVSEPQPTLPIDSSLASIHQISPSPDDGPLPETPKTQPDEEVETTVSVGTLPRIASLQLAKTAAPLDLNWSAEGFAKGIATQFAEANSSLTFEERNESLLEVFALVAEASGTELRQVVNIFKQPGPDEAPPTAVLPADQTPPFEAESGPEAYVGSVRSWPERVTSTPVPAIPAGNWSALADGIAQGYGDQIDSAFNGLPPQAGADCAQNFFSALIKMFLTPRYGADVISVEVHFKPAKLNGRKGQILTREPEPQSSGLLF